MARYCTNDGGHFLLRRECLCPLHKEQGRAGKLIGVKGATIQGLCETWGVKIAVRDAGEVMVTGKEDAVKDAMSACMVAIDMSTSSIDFI